jgi:hypothetical protein
LFSLIFKINKTIISDNFFVETVASPSRLEFNLILRPLRLDDFNRGFLQLLQQLTKVGNVDENLFKGKA